MIHLLIVTPAFNEAVVLPDFIEAALALRRELNGTVDVRLRVGRRMAWTTIAPVSCHDSTSFATTGIGCSRSASIVTIACGQVPALHSPAVKAAWCPALAVSDR